MQTLTTDAGMRIRIYDSNNPNSAVPPTPINYYSVLTIPAYWRAMRFLSENLAAFPRSIHKDGSPADSPHPLDGLLKRSPNGYQTGTNFWRALYLDAAHSNNGYARIERDKGMRPVALHYCPSWDVVPFRITKDGSTQQWYYVRSEQAIHAGADFIHFVGLSCDGMIGIDTIHVHADTFQRAKTLDRYQTRFLMKGTVIVGSVEVPGLMDDDDFAKLRSLLRSQFRGTEAEDDILILTGGAKLNNAGTSPRDSQLIEQAGFTTKQIGQVTGVHPYFLYDDRDGKYNNNGEQAGIDVVKYTFRPWIDLAVDELSTKLLSTAELEAGFKVMLDPAALMSCDTGTLTKTTVDQVGAGLRTRNEGRKVLGLPRNNDPESDKLKTLGDTSPTKPAAAAAVPKQNALAALQPVLKFSCNRVEAKTAKAFESAEKKTGQERIVWGNVFAEEQRRYAIEALRPIADSLAAMGEPIDIDVEKIADRYAAGIRKRVASRVVVTLAETFAEVVKPPVVVE